MKNIKYDIDKLDQFHEKENTKLIKLYAKNKNKKSYHDKKYKTYHHSENIIKEIIYLLNSKDIKNVRNYNYDIIIKYGFDSKLLNQYLYLNMYKYVLVINVDNTSEKFKLFEKNNGLIYEYLNEIYLTFSYQTDKLAYLKSFDNILEYNNYYNHNKIYLGFNTLNDIEQFFIDHINYPFKDIFNVHEKKYSEEYSFYKHSKIYKELFINIIMLMYSKNLKKLNYENKLLKIKPVLDLYLSEDESNIIVNDLIYKDYSLLKEIHNKLENYNKIKHRKIERPYYKSPFYYINKRTKIKTELNKMTSLYNNNNHDINNIEFVIDEKVQDID